MAHRVLDYSRWDSLEEPSDDEDSGACIGLPGKDGSPGTVYKWEDLRTELPWQQQAPDVPAASSSAPRADDHAAAVATAAPTAAPAAAPPAAAAPMLVPPLPDEADKTGLEVWKQVDENSVRDGTGTVLATDSITVIRVVLSGRDVASYTGVQRHDPAGALVFSSGTIDYSISACKRLLTLVDADGSQHVVRVDEENGELIDDDWQELQPTSAAAASAEPAEPAAANATNSTRRGPRRSRARRVSAFFIASKWGARCDARASANPR